MRNYGLYINGQYTQSSAAREAKSPFLSEPLARYAFLDDNPADGALLDEALTGVDETFAQICDGFFPLAERLEFLLRLRERILSQIDAFTHTITHEVGKPVSLARGEVKRALSTLEWTCIEAPRVFGGEALPTAARSDWKGLTGWTAREPRGPILAISPFNFPLNLVLHKLAPAIAAGCPVVLKPSPKAALTALTLADFCHAAGLPPGMLSVVQCADALTLKMAHDPRIAQISFTGSAKVGWSLAAGLTKPIFLELGGNAPVFVDETADLSLAAKKIVAGAFGYAGQVCISVQNIFVARKAESFAKILAEETGRFSWGDPTDEAVQSGPVIDAAAYARLKATRERVLKSGGRIFAEAVGPDRVGILRPEIFSGVSPNDPAVTDELFGPFANFFYVEDFDAFAKIANANAGRLQTGVFTCDARTLHRAPKALRYGGVLINESSALRLDPMPYGGNGLAGRGREGPRYAMQDYTELKAVIVRSN